MSKYVSNYDSQTHLLSEKIPNAFDMIERQINLRKYKLICIGESWFKNYGISPVWEGPLLDEEIQNLLCIRLISD